MSLEQIKKQLTACYKERQPVLLYGKDDYDRKKLLEEVHVRNVGIDVPPTEWEYEGDDESTKVIDGLRDELRNLLPDPLGDIKRNKLYKEHEQKFGTYMLDWKDTPRTYKYDDWSRKSGQAVSDDLSRFEYKRIDSSGKMVSTLLDVKTWHIRDWMQSIRIQHKKSDTKRLLDYKGLLFLDNLRCKREDAVDENGYVEIALKINSLSKIPRSQRGWLVFYTRDYSNFPPEFIEQFEPEGLVLLNRERTTSESLLKGTRQKAKTISGIIKKRGRKPKHPKYDEFVEISKDILKDDKNDSLGGYVIKVRAEMKRKGLKDEKKKNKLIYEDSTIRKYIQDHPEYKKIQKRKG